MTKIDRKLKEIAPLIKSFSKEVQKDIRWMIKNSAFLDLLSTGKKFSEIELKFYLDFALQKKDYRMIAILLNKQRKDRERR